MVPQDWQLLTAHENGMLQVRFGFLLLLLLLLPLSWLHHFVAILAPA